MTLPEIDDVSFLVEHAQTFFAGQLATYMYMRRMRNNNLEITITGSSYRPQLTQSSENRILQLLIIDRYCE